MENRDKKSFILSIILSLLIIPIILMFIYYQFQNYFILLIIGLFFTVILIYIFGKPDLTKIGVTIGLIAWMLNLYVALSVIIDYSLMQINAGVLKFSLDFLMDTPSPLEQIFLYNIPTIAFNSPFMIIIVLNLISASFSIVLGFIIFERRRKWIKDMDKDNLENNQNIIN